MLFTFCNMTIFNIT